MKYADHLAFMGKLSGICLCIALTSGCGTSENSSTQTGDSDDLLKSYIHVSTTGRVGALGTQEDPFNSIQAAADVVTPGETVFIHEGVYRETVTIPTSGTADAPITFEGMPGCTIVNGADDLETEWIVEQGGVYKSAGPVTATTQVFVNGKMMNIARWPNAQVDHLVDAPMATTQEGTNQQQLVDSSLPDGDWSGAHVFMVPGAAWVAWTRQITSHDMEANALGYESPITHEVEMIHPSAGNSYYLFGHLALLDTPGEWYQDETGVLYMIPPADVDMNTAHIELKSRTHAFDLTDKSFITLKNLLVFGASVHMENATGCIADGVHLRYPIHHMEIDGYASADEGTFISGRDNVFKNGSVSFASDSGLFLNGTHNTVHNNYIHDVSYRVGGSMGGVATPYDGGSREHVIEDNTIFNVGRFGIGHMDLAAGTIKRNHIYDVGLLSSDLGGIYTWDCDGEGTEISYNIVEDINRPLGSGIYLDDGSINHVVHHNVVRNTRFHGIIVKAPNHIQNNTIMNSGDAPIGIIDVKPAHHHDQSAVDISTASIFNNNASFSRVSVELTVPPESAGRESEVGYVRTLDSTSEWTTVEVGYDSLEQISWSYPALPFSANDIGKIGFRVVGMGEFVVELDNIYLVASNGSRLLIDDFEDKDEQGEQGGWWWAGGGASDESCETCAKSSAELQIITDENSNTMASVAMTSAANGWNILVLEQPTVPFQDYQTIQFDYRITGDAVLEGATGTPKQGANQFCPVNDQGVDLGNCATDAGVKSDVFWGEFEGASPDIGAFEANQVTWTAGSSVDDSIWNQCLASW